MATGMQGLLVWCKQITKLYGDEIAVKNMTTSWKNGMAFCAIIHHFRPDLIDFNKLSKENIADNNALAFTTAEDELGIPALLDVEDMVEMRVPDRLSIMTYVSQYYNYFKDKVPGEIEARKSIPKKRSTKSPSESLPAKRAMDVKEVSPVLQKTIPSVNKNACWSCSKTVYLMERLSVEGNLFHRICFKCTVCGKQLKNSTYEYDKITSKFYCAKDFKDRKGNEPVNVCNIDDPTNNSNLEEMDHSDVAETKSNSIKDNEKSPFKRNEHFYRQGIHPQSPVKEPHDGTINTIKSKEDVSKVKGKVKHGKSIFSGVIGKKHKSGHHEFANPSYDKQLDLSNFMHRLGGSKETSPEPPVEGTHPDAGDHDHSNRLPQLLGQTAVKNETSENVKNGDGNKGAKGHKKKLVLKLKKKKEKKVITEDNCNDNKKSDVDNINKKTDTTTSEQSCVVKESEYENIGIYRRRTSASDNNVEKIYDNVNLCKVIQTEKIDPNLKIYDNCNLKSQQASPGKTNGYKDDINIYATPNIGAKAKDRSTLVYETMESGETETVENNSDKYDDTSKAQYMSIGNGLDNIDIDKHSEDSDVNTHNKTINTNEENEIDKNDVNNSSLDTSDDANLDNTYTEDTDNFTNNKSDDLVDHDNEIIDNNKLDTSIEVNDKIISDTDVNINDDSNEHIVDNENIFSDNFIDVSERYVQNDVLSDNSTIENSIDTIGNNDNIIDPGVGVSDGSSSHGAVNDNTEDETFNIKNEELIINNNEVNRLDNSIDEIKDNKSCNMEDKISNLDDDLDDHVEDSNFIDCSIGDNFDLRSRETLQISENNDAIESSEEKDDINININVNVNVNVDNEVRDGANEMDIDGNSDYELKTEGSLGHGSQNSLPDLDTSIEARETSPEECMDITLKTEGSPSHGSQNSLTDLNTSIEEKETSPEECMDVAQEKSIEKTSIESQLDLHPEVSSECECKTDESKSPSEDTISVEHEEIGKSYSVDEDLTGKQTDGVQQLEAKDTPVIHVESEENVVNTELDIGTSVMSDENVLPVHVQIKQSALLDSDLSDNPRESLFIVSSDNPFTDSDLDIENEKETDNCMEEDKLSSIGTPAGTVVLTEVSVEDNMELDKKSLEGDDGLGKEENLNDDSVTVETHVEKHIKKSEELNPFLSSDSSPEMKPKKDTSNPFLSSSDEESDDDEDFEDYDDTNPFAEDVRLERSNTSEKHKGKPSATDKFQIGILEETNPFADDILDPTNPFSDEFDEEYLVNNVPEIVSSIPKSDKKLVLKTKAGITVRKNSEQNLLNSTPSAKLRRKKRTAPKAPNISAASTPSPVLHRQSVKKRHAPKPPGAVNYATKFNLMEKRNDAEGRNSIRKRQAPRPPEIATQRNEAKGEFGTTCDSKSDSNLSNISNTSDSKEVTLNVNEDLEDGRCIVGNDAECHSPEKLEGEGDSGLSPRCSSPDLAEESNLDIDDIQHFVGDEEGDSININQEQIDSSISEEQSGLKYDEQLQLNSTKDSCNLKVENVSIDSSSLPIYESTDQTFNDDVLDIDTSVSNTQSHHTCEQLNSTEDLSNIHESNVSITSSSSDSLDHQEIIDDKSIHDDTPVSNVSIQSDQLDHQEIIYDKSIHDDTPVSNVSIQSESEKQTVNSTDLCNLEANVSSASSNSLVSRSDSVSKCIESNTLTETKSLNDDGTSLSKSSNQDGSLSSMCTEYNEDECSMTECELYENKTLNHLEIGTTNSLPNQKAVNNVSNSELRSSLPNIYGSTEKRKAPPKPPRQYTEGVGPDGVVHRQEGSKREEMEKELQFLEVKQRELEMEGVVMEKRLRECSDGEPEEAYLLTWFELVNQKNMLLRRENELIYLCQEMDFLQNQRSAEFELRQLMMKPDDEKTEYDAHREEELLAEILDFVTKRSNIVDQMDEDRIREYEEDQEIFSMMAAQGLKTSSANISEETSKTKNKEKKKKIKDKTASKEKKELKIKKSKEKVESNGTSKLPGKEKNSSKELTKEKIDSKTKKKVKQERKESKVK